MRDLVINKLKAIIEASAGHGGYGIPRYFDCDDEEYITDAEELRNMDDEQLLEVFEATVGFQG